MRQLKNYPNNRHFLGSSNSPGVLPIGLSIVIYYRISPLCQIIDQSIRRYIFWHLLSLSSSSELNKVLFDAMWRLIWLVNVLVLSQSDPQTQISCNDALDNCKRDLKCLILLNRVFNRRICSSALGFDDDNQIRGGMQKTCPATCVQAIKNLTSSPRGRLLESCSCKREATCLTTKARLQRCVLMSDKNYKILGCTKARKRCTEDENCNKFQNSFLRRCTFLISGVNCTEDCKSSQNELLNSELGKALNDCECDGSEELYCRGIRANYEDLCKLKTRTTRNHNVVITTREKTVGERNSNGNRRFELPLWILCVAIIAHVCVLYSR